MMLSSARSASCWIQARGDYGPRDAAERSRECIAVHGARGAPILVSVVSPDAPCATAVAEENHRATSRAAVAGRAWRIAIFKLIEVVHLPWPLPMAVAPPLPLPRAGVDGDEAIATGCSQWRD